MKNIGDCLYFLSVARFFSQVMINVDGYTTEKRFAAKPIYVRRVEEPAVLPCPASKGRNLWIRVRTLPMPALLLLS